MNRLSELIRQSSGGPGGSGREKATSRNLPPRVQTSPRKGSQVRGLLKRLNTTRKALSWLSTR